MVTKRTPRAATALVTWLGCGLVMAAESGQRISFVNCPVVRDTATVPCWLSEYEGEIYFLTLQTDVSSPVTPPWLGHRVLVEGTISDEPRICGGIVVKPVHLSVLPDIDTSCNQVLPAEDKYNLTFEAPRPPGPSTGRLAFDNLRQTPAAASPAAGAAGVREFVVPYAFDGLVGFGHPRFLRQVLDYAIKSKTSEIEIVGYRGAALLSNGQTLLEQPDIGKQRAEQVAMLLKSTELQASTFKVRWLEEPEPVNGTNDHLTRRVVVKVHTR